MRKWPPSPTPAGTGSRQGLCWSVTLFVTDVSTPGPWSPSLRVRWATRPSFSGEGAGWALGKVSRGGEQGSRAQGALTEGRSPGHMREQEGFSDQEMAERTPRMAGKGGTGVHTGVAAPVPGREPGPSKAGEVTEEPAVKPLPGRPP